MRPDYSVRLAAATLFAVGVSAGYAQQVISAQSGTVHYIEGSVYVEQKKVESKFGQFPSLKQGQDLRTEDGRVEMLLTPGAFLRVAEHSSIRMLANHLSDTRVEILSGSAMVECDELLPDNSLMLVFHGDNIKLEKQGLYRLDADRASFSVYDGQAVVKSDTGQLTLKKGKQTGLNGVLQAEHFNTKIGDNFLAWNQQRSGYLAYASVTAAQSLRSSGASWVSGGWGWSPLLDEFTFVPGAGIIYSPFGWQFWSPYTTGFYNYVPPYFVLPYYYGGSFLGSGVSKPATTTANNNTQGGRPAPGTNRGTNGFVGGGRPVQVGEPGGRVRGFSQPPAGGGFSGSRASAPMPSGGSFGGSHGSAPTQSGGGFGGGHMSAPSSSGANFGGGHMGGAATSSGGAASSGRSASK
jgi:hypothetical protein